MRPAPGVDRGDGPLARFRVPRSADDREAVPDEPAAHLATDPAIRAGDDRDRQGSEDRRGQAGHVTSLAPAGRCGSARRPGP